MMTRKERQEYSAQLAQREAERKARQAAFKADPAGKAPAMVKGKEQDARVAQKHRENGTTALGPLKSHDRRSGTRSLILAGMDKASADDVYGHNARERAQLPTRPLTPSKYGSKLRSKQPTHGLTTFGPDFRVKGGNRKKKRKQAEPKFRKGFVADVPEHLKKYLSA
jgi:hypothetical protein